MGILMEELESITSEDVCLKSNDKSNKHFYRLPSAIKIVGQRIGETIIGIIFVMPISTVCSVCEAIKDIKIGINNYYQKQQLLKENPDYIIPYHSIDKQSDLLKNSIYVFDETYGLERADKKILLRTNKPVYVTIKSNRIIR